MPIPDDYLMSTCEGCGETWSTSEEETLALSELTRTAFIKWQNETSEGSLVWDPKEVEARVGATCRDVSLRCILQHLTGRLWEVAQKHGLTYLPPPQFDRSSDHDLDIEVTWFDTQLRRSVNLYLENGLTMSVHDRGTVVEKANPNDADLAAAMRWIGARTTLLRIPERLTRVTAASPVRA